MNRLLSAAFVLLLSATPSQLFAKGETTKITIKGLYLKAPIEIVDPVILSKFNIWTWTGHMVERPRLQCECTGLHR